MAYIRKIKASLVQQDSSEYLGEETYLFYDIEKNCLRVSDGQTPGGFPACIEWSGIGNKPSPTITLIGDVEGSGTLIELQDGIITTTVPSLADKVDWAVVGQPNGVASLNSNGKVPPEQLPEYEPPSDDILVFPTYSDFPTVGESDKVYVAANTNKTYRWTGTDYVLIGDGTNDAIFVGGLEQYIKTVPSGNLLAVHSIVPTGNLTSKFIISVLDTVDGRFASSEILGSYNHSTKAVYHTHYTRTGDPIRYVAEVEYSNPDLNLNIINNDVNTVIVTITRVSNLPLL